MSQYYEKYGGNNPITQKNADPVQCCLEGSYLNCPENPFRFEKGLCTKFMGQRCARGWDQYCDLYLEEQSSSDFTGKKVTEFLTEAFSSKFCRDDTSDPNSKCYTRCEMLNPLSNNSATVCKTYGNNAYRDIRNVQAVSTGFLLDAKLDAATPLSVHKCPKTCDILAMNSFGEDDRVLNEVLDRGIAQNAVMNLAQNIVKSGLSINNTRLQNFISKYIDTSNSKEGFDADLSLTSQLGKTNVLSTSNYPTPMSSKVPAYSVVSDSSYPDRTLAIPPNTIYTGLPNASTVMEKKKQESDKKGQMMVILIVLIICYLLYLSSKKK